MSQEQSAATSSSEGDVWFDGVSKQLLKVHAEPKQVVPATKSNLMTLNPLHTVFNQPSKKNPHSGLTKELAIDCEMVECYHNKSVLARVSIVNLYGYPILDKYVAPPSQVTDYRTKWSGIRYKDLVDAPDFKSVQSEVKALLKGRIAVGHAIHNDFGVLKINHPPEDVRDTSHYFKSLFGGQTPSLKKLTERLLGVKIQTSSHDSVQDAQATMKLFVQVRDEWNKKSAKNSSKKIHHNHQHKHNSANQPKKKKMKAFFVLNT